MSTIINLNDMPWEHRQSPKGKFGRYVRNFTDAQGWTEERGTPFDLAQVRLPPGKTNFPLHAHTAQWEAYYIQSGSGVHVIGDREEPIRAGDAYTIRPGIAHQMRNTGEEDIVYIVIANNPPVEIGYYPKTGKVVILPDDVLFRPEAAGYFDGEE